MLTQNKQKIIGWVKQTTWLASPKKLSKGHKLKGNKRSLRKIVPVADKKSWRLSGRLGPNVNLGYEMQSSRKRYHFRLWGTRKGGRKFINIIRLIYVFYFGLLQGKYHGIYSELGFCGESSGFTSGSFGHSRCWTRWRSSLSPCPWPESEQHGLMGLLSALDAWKVLNA